jgi:polar amino acid transport system substrate-binding protein
MLRFCIFAMGLAASISFAEELGGCSRPITVAASPLGETMKIDQNNGVSGILAETLAKIEKETGCHFVYQVLPRARALWMFEKGEVDLIAAAQLPSRDAAGVFLPVMLLQNTLITRKSRQTQIPPMERLQSGALMVNVVRGINTGPAYMALLDDLRRKNKLEEVVDLDVVANKMAVNRADATILPPLIFMLAAKTYGIENDLNITLFTPTQISPVGFYLSKTKLSTQDSLVLKSAFERAIESGEIWRMYQSRLPEWTLLGATPVGIKK